MKRLKSGKKTAEIEEWDSDTNGSVIPSKTGYVFSPADTNITIIAQAFGDLEDIPGPETGVDFVDDILWESLDCDIEPIVLTTTDGVQFVRTPPSCFENLPDFPYEAKYVEIGGLRQGYVDEGPADADPAILLHSQPS